METREGMIKSFLQNVRVINCELHFFPPYMQIVQCSHLIVLNTARVIQAHNRMSSSSAESSCPRLILSGARGIGGVQSFRGIGHAIDLFDLEEDEETEE